MKNRRFQQLFLSSILIVVCTASFSFGGIFENSNMTAPKSAIDIAKKTPYSSTKKYLENTGNSVYFGTTQSGGVDKTKSADSDFWTIQSTTSSGFRRIGLTLNVPNYKYHEATLKYRISVYKDGQRREISPYFRYIATYTNGWTQEMVDFNMVQDIILATFSGGLFQMSFINYRYDVEHTLTSTYRNVDPEYGNDFFREYVALDSIDFYFYIPQTTADYMTLELDYVKLETIDFSYRSIGHVMSYATTEGSIKSTPSFCLDYDDGDDLRAESTTSGFTRKLDILFDMTDKEYVYFEVDWSLEYDSWTTPDNIVLYLNYADGTSGRIYTPGAMLPGQSDMPEGAWVFDGLYYKQNIAISSLEFKKEASFWDGFEAHFDCIRAYYYTYY